MPSLKTVAGAAALLGFGMLEGYAFTAAGVVVPAAMKQQMSFASFAIMKMFLSAVGSSMLAQAALNASGRSFDETRQYARKALSPSMVASGCAMLGAGMYLCGSGPTMMPSQLAAGITSAPYILAGAFAGGVFYALIEKYLPRNCGKPLQPLDGFRSYTKIAVPAGLALVGASFGIEQLFPASADFSQHVAFGLSSTMLPSVAGLILGFNQIPLRLIAGRGQGGSTPVVGIIATATGGALQGKHQMKSLHSAMQTIYVYPGTFLGALLAAQMVGFTPVQYSHMDAFVGGFLMLLGGRIADGCTCGHGITGFSELSPVSMLGTAFIFGGGMLAAALKLGF